MSVVPTNWLDPVPRRNAYAILRLYNGGAHRGSLDLVGSLSAEELAAALLAMTDLANRLLTSWVHVAGVGRRAAEGGVDPAEVMQKYLEDLLLAAAAEAID